jgi:hypothetical protein
VDDDAHGNEATLVPVNLDCHIFSISLEQESGAYCL